MSKTTATTAQTFQVVTMNMKDGSVQGHAAGCADLKRGVRKFAEPQQADWPMTVSTKHEAWLDYNQDFIADGEDMGTYGIDWLPCAKHVPQGLPDTIESVEMDEAPAKPVVTAKVGPKWAYIFVDGEQVAEVRSQFVDAVLLTIISSL